MKTRLPKTLLAALLACSTVVATEREQVILPAGTNIIQNEATISNTHYVAESSSTSRFKKQLSADNCKFEATNAGSMILFDGKTELKNSEVVGKVSFSSEPGSSLALKGGNTFTTYKTQDVSILCKGTTTVEGDNSFYGATNVNRLQVISGTQKFENKITDSSQTMSFCAVGFAAEADESAAIDVSVDRGWLFFRDDCSISTLETSDCVVRLWNSLTVKDSITLNAGTKFDVNAAKGAVIILEIDSISELLDASVALTSDDVLASTNAMLSLADDVSLDKIDKVQLLFTENAIQELEASKGPLTFNLSKVTNAANIDLELTVADGQDKTAEEIFGGTTTFTTGASGSADNYITINAVPEPTTATLSLLALAGLCARRRRR